MSEKKRISISKPLSQYISSLSRNTDNTAVEESNVAWSKHINRMLIDHISLLEEHTLSVLKKLDPEVLHALKMITKSHSESLFLYKYGQDIHKFIFSIYVDEFGLNEMDATIKHALIEDFTKLRLTKVESLALISYLQREQCTQ
ncbi:TPA: hypothetical protein ACF0SF_003404 [Acinetobacter nosocomialis]|uniref:Uncharacterized protein n=1 Tax=Acinetobacter ursingii TaxID=108980 RepID=A0AA46NSJ6_9GAMM|nr:MULTISPECIES: hypothetical protein [Acinetobacter]UKC63562.1 hypothetical protein FA267_2_00088 [Acinetobacter nosocomialis]UKC63742.1 hypothetical protein FA648_2_00133 [Acinetobacter nosocomialis]UTO21318.1 hypothetical protein NGC85_17170 [Acinetobacter sp. Z1]UYF77378.1 hypothetical protein LSO58_18740 [Acinetobacter ursingii]WOF72114.1 hypothetical protein [Acinetobacter junii]